MTETLDEIVPDDVQDAVRVVLQKACDLEVRLVTAESCTGGLLASLLTDVDGCAHAFERGFVTYTDESKAEVLGVDPELIANRGAVSEPVARAMAEGALAASKGDVALSVTGFAGRGGPDDTPGLVHFAVSRPGAATRRRVKRFGDIGRGPIRIACLRVAVDLFRVALDDLAAAGRAIADEAP